MPDCDDRVHAAEQQVRAAVEALNLALAEDAGETPGVAMDHVLVYAVRKFGEDGDTLTRIAWNTSEGGWHTSLGLIEYARNRFRHIINDLEDTDD